MRRFNVPGWALVGLGSALLGFAIGGATARDGSIFGPTVAAWMQVITTVAAIVTALIVAYIPINEQRRAAKERAANMARAARRLLANGEEFLDSIEARITLTEVPHRVQDLQAILYRISALIDPLDRFPSQDLDDHRPVGLASGLQHMSGVLRDTMGVIQMAAVMPPGGNAETTIELSADVEDRLLRAIQRAREIVAELDR